MAAKTASLSVNIIADAAKAKSGLKEAEGAFGKFKNSVGEANGAMGKFKVAGGAALDYVKSNAMNFAAAAGAAIVAFGIKSVNAFQDLTLTVSKFSDATGMTLDSASRFIEVAGDIGIEAGTLEKSLNFMNKTLGNSPDLFNQLGIEIEYTSGGAKDMSGTFLNVIDKINGIKDPAEKAAVASKLLGRGWAEMAELIATGSGSLSKSLSEVSKSKIITPEQERQAKDFRAATDNLKDAFEDLTQEVGQQLVPILTDAFEGISKFIDKAKEISEIDVPGPKGLGDWLSFAIRAPIDLQGAIKALFDTGETVEDVNAVTDDMYRVWSEGTRAMIDAVPPAQNLNSTIERQEALLNRARAAWDLYKNNLNIQLQRFQLEGDIEAFRKKWESATDDAKSNSREYQEEVMRMRIQVVMFGTDIMSTATIAAQNRFKMLVDTTQLERALTLLDALRSGQGLRPTYGPESIPNKTYGTTPAPIIKTPSSMTVPTLTDKQRELLRLAGLARGGTLTSSGLVMVGEQGPEVLQLPRGASVTPNIPARLDNMAAGGTTIVVNVQAGLVSSPDQVGQQIIDAIRRAERRSGQVFAAA
jgi:hypothetical protein